MGRLIVSPLEDGKRWEVMEAFVVPVGGHFEYVEVSKGFTTDFASVPSLFWAIIPRWGKYGTAAVVHDYLYKHHTIVLRENGIQWGGRGVTRKESDDIFHTLMLRYGTKPWKAFVMYWAVRLFGWMAWRN